MKASTALLLSLAAAAGAWRWTAPALIMPPPGSERAPQAPAAPEFASPFAPVATISGPAPAPPPPAAAPVRAPDPACRDERALDAEVRTAPSSAASLAAAIDLLHDGTDAQRAAALLVGGRTEDAAALGAASADPLAYAIAWQACQQGDAPSCGRLQPAQWTLVDPGNAVAWLALAERAAAEGRAGDEVDAMRAAAAAPFAAGHRNAVAALLGAVLRGRAGLGAGTAMQALAVGWHAASAWRPVGLGEIERFCAWDALDDGRRRADCETLAGMLVERAADLDLRDAGIALAHRLGWPPAQVDQLAQEQDALEEIATPPAMVFALDCDEPRRLQRWAESLEADGEVARLHVLLLDSGHSAQDWSERRQRDRELAANAAAAAGSARCAAGCG